MLHVGEAWRLDLVVVEPMLSKILITPAAGEPEVNSWFYNEQLIFNANNETTN